MALGKPYNSVIIAHRKRGEHSGMEIELEVLRCEGPDSKPYTQRIRYVGENENATVATALTEINADPDARDTAGNPVSAIRWEHSCLQRKCGGCAMVINHRPRLACDTRLRDYNGVIRLEPLRKFPLIADLMVDRSILRENLKTIGAWLREETTAEEAVTGTAYEASRCLQCGCCLEVCPNFYGGGRFFGMAAMVPVARLISELPKSRQKELYGAYKKHVYGGCGKSLACRDICPAGIDIEMLLSRTNGSVYRLH